MKTQDIIPIRTQVVIWLIAGLFVGICHFVALDMYHPIPVIVTIGLILTMLGLPPTVLDEIDFRACLYWWALCVISSTAATFIRPALHVLSDTTPTSRQVLLLHWCIAFFVISKAEWWKHRGDVIDHPSHRDQRQSGDRETLSLKAFTLDAFRLVIVSAIMYGLVFGLRILCDVPGPWGRYSNGLFSPAGLTGEVLQAMVLLRPMKHLTAWLTEGAMDGLSIIWLRIRELRDRALNLNHEPFGSIREVVVGGSDKPLATTSIAWYGLLINRTLICGYGHHCVSIHFSVCVPVKQILLYHNATFHSISLFVVCLVL
jgi:hypothetical protein